MTGIGTHMTGFTLGQGRREALLIATGTYDDRTLSTLRSPGQDCASLAEVLADPGIGAFRTEQLKDARARQVMRAVERFFMNRSGDDLLLLHISCHGIKDDDGHLYFATRDTDRDLPASTAVPAAFLRDRMERCRARTVVVLLDCCYSGAFLTGTKADDQIHIRDELGGQGRVVLTATNRTEYAWEGERVESKVPQPSRFTGALVEGLSTGAADLDGDGRITVTELYDYVYESLHHAGVKQHPRMWADLEYRVTIARAVGGSSPPSGGTDGLSQTPKAHQQQEPPEQPGQYPRRKRGQDASIRLELTLEEAAFGTTKDIQLDTAVLCPTCSGSSMLLTVPCQECAGEGRVRSCRTITVKIPAGVDHETRMRLAGESEIGPGGGPPGDLYLEIMQLVHPVFFRVNDVLYCDLPVTAATAKSGGTVGLETLHGRKTVRIPPGTRNGQMLRLAGLGIKHLGSDDHGDILAQVKIYD